MGVRIVFPLTSSLFATVRYANHVYPTLLKAYEIYSIFHDKFSRRTTQCIRLANDRRLKSFTGGGGTVQNLALSETRIEKKPTDLVS